MNYTHAIGQGQMLVGLKDRAKTARRTEVIALPPLLVRSVIKRKRRQIRRRKLNNGLMPPIYSERFLQILY